MGFLQKLLDYDTIVLQCHNIPDPDTLAAAYGVYLFLVSHGKKVQMIYGGAEKIKRKNLKTMILDCGIPIRHVNTDSDVAFSEMELLVTIDCQYGLGNVQKFDAPQVAMIDHHVNTVGDRPLCLIKNQYQSCSTIVYELLLEEGYDVLQNKKLSTAFLFGLYIDTAAYQDLYYQADMDMKQRLPADELLLDRMIKSTLTEAELFIAGDALYNHYMDVQRKFILVSAINCDQAVLGVISSLVIQVDSCVLAVVYTQADGCYSFSIRGYNEQYSACELAKSLTNGIGSGGGHLGKAGGRISREMLERTYGRERIKNELDAVIIERICEYMDAQGEPK